MVHYPKSMKNKKQKHSTIILIDILKLKIFAITMKYCSSGVVISDMKVDNVFQVGFLYTDGKRVRGMEGEGNKSSSLKKFYITA